MTVSEKSSTLAGIAARAADERKGENIVAIDVSNVMAIADAFVIVSASNERQVRAIVEEIEDDLTAAGEEPLRREGNREKPVGPPRLRRTCRPRPTRTRTRILRPRPPLP